MKKLIPLILTMLILCGCSSLLDGFQEHSIPHHNSTIDSEADSDQLYIEVSDYSDLQQAFDTMVTAHAEKGIIRFSSYNGNIENDLNNARINLTNNTAIGSYSVSDIDSSLNRYVSYYEATISIIYRKSASDIENIKTANTQEELNSILYNILNTCLPDVTIKTSDYSVNIDTITSSLNDLYYSDPQLIISLPSMNIIEHADDSRIVRIYEITMEYPEPASTMLGKRNAFKTILEQISFSLDDTDNKTKLLYQLCTYLSARAEYTGTVPDEDFVQYASENTAYGALYNGKASGEGFAMAMKLLCDWQDIECVVVKGRYNNYIHAWNMIKVDGDWYHFDITKLSDGASKALLLTDRQMERNYLWESSDEYICDGNLNYTYLTDSGAAEQPVVVSKPVNPENNEDNSSDEQANMDQIEDNEEAAE